MSSNRAFIDAFRSTVGRVDPFVRELSGASALEPNPVWTASFSTSEYLGGGVNSHPEVEEAGHFVAAHPQNEGKKENIFCFGPRVPLRAKQTLASLIAGTETEGESAFQAPVPSTHEVPRWPMICQQLLADASCEYDSLLRVLTEAPSTGMLMGVTGVTPKSGCTTTAICLALRAAALGKSTLLVDADWNQPRMASVLEIQSTEPWPNLIRRGRSVLEGILSQGDAGVDLLLNAKGGLFEVDAASTFRLALAAGAMRRKYQCVIFDLGFVGDECPGADVAVALGIDQVLLVANPNSSDQEVDLALSGVERRRMAVNGILRAA